MIHHNRERLDHRTSRDKAVLTAMWLAAAIETAQKRLRTHPETTDIRVETFLSQTVR